MSAGSTTKEHKQILTWDYRDWKAYGGGPESICYSSLTQINRENVNRIRVAWSYDTEDSFSSSEMQCNPIIVGGIIYITSPRLRAIALDAATGRLIWSFDPFDGSFPAHTMRNRGVTFWEDGDDKRVFYSAREYLYGLNAETGRLIESFGNRGRVDLREGLNRDPSSLSVIATSPGIIFKDLLIMGSTVSESLPSAPGDIRAYDVRSGKIRWVFHTIPHPGEDGYDTWPKDAWKFIGGANCWAGMSVDWERGIVFCPTGSAAFDFYGGNRLGDNLFANSLIALKATSGERIWHFQTVRHDVWDRDLPSPPSLVRVQREGRVVDAVAQTTKSGYVYVFERETGNPLFPIEYRKVPPSEIPGETLATEQPFPLRPWPFARQSLTEDMLTKRTPAAHRAILKRFRILRNGGQFTPPSLEGTVLFPGYDGGAEWGGSAFDPETGVLYVNSNDMPFVVSLVENKLPTAQASSNELYQEHCADCHGAQMEGGARGFPPLLNLAQRLAPEKIRALIANGSGRMPGFKHLGSAAVDALMDYLTTGETRRVSVDRAPSSVDMKYRHGDDKFFQDPEGYPAVEPPWGTLNAINLNTGAYVWKIPLGEIPELVKKGLRNTGGDNYGGPLVTAGGLLFIGATNHDRKFRAFDKSTGELLWETTLPAAGNATPATYEIKNKQYVVIAAGGGKRGQPSGGSYVAFALP